MTGLTFGQRALPHRLVESNWLGGERARHRNDRRLKPGFIVRTLAERRVDCLGMITSLALDPYKVLFSDAVSLRQRGSQHLSFAFETDKFFFVFIH